MAKQENQHLEKAGKFLRGLRLRTGMTQQQLCEKLQLTKGFNLVSQVERGAIRLPLKHVIKFADAVEVNQKTLARKLVAYYEPDLCDALGFKRAA